MESVNYLVTTFAKCFDSYMTYKYIELGGAILIILAVIILGGFMLYKLIRGLE